MAKALFGHVGGSDLRLVDEVRRLRNRVRALEAELARVERDQRRAHGRRARRGRPALPHADDEPALT
jgi:uncharacterized small protein (DUF1192 family)